MSEKEPLKQLEQEAYLRMHEDGILDLTLGLTLLGIGSFLISRESALSILVWMSVLFYKPLKDRITVPRLGTVRFGEDRRRKLSGMKAVYAIGIGLLLLAGCTVLALIENLPAWLDENLFPIIGACVAAVLFLNGVLLGIRLLILYAAITAGLSILSLFSNPSQGWMLILFGGLLSGIGIFRMIRFVRKVPKDALPGNPGIE